MYNTCKGCKTICRDCTTTWIGNLATLLAFGLDEQKVQNKAARRRGRRPRRGRYFTNSFDEFQ